ncbi:MAG: hypothetical protein QOI47_242 [Actinomycetota bacterium]|nr:hypothetical protein [Actinomycetota bacterium]
MNDIALLATAVDEASRLIGGITPDQLGDPTPCEDFTVGQLVDHLASGLGDFAVRLDGGAPAAPTWSVVGPRLVAAFEVPGALDGDLELAYGTFPRTTVLHHALGETAIHAGDLARATGQPVSDAFTPVCERSLEVVGDEWRVEGVLGPPIECPAGAPPVDRLLAFAGRKI